MSNHRRIIPEASSISNGIILETSPVDRNDPKYSCAVREAYGLASGIAESGKPARYEDASNLIAYSITPEFREYAISRGVSDQEIVSNPALIEDLAAEALERNPRAFDSFLDSLDYSNAVTGSLFGGLTDTQKTTVTRISPKSSYKPGKAGKIALVGAAAAMALGGTIAYLESQNPDQDQYPDYRDPHPVVHEGWFENSDGDPYSDNFEKLISHTDPYTKNNVYAILATIERKGPNGELFEGYFEMEKIHDNLLENKIPHENIILLESVKPESLKDAITDVSAKATPNDIVYIAMHIHGTKESFVFCNDCDISMQYEEFGKELGKIDSKVILTLDSCKPGRAIPFLEGDSRIIMTQVGDDQIGATAAMSYGFVMSSSDSFVKKEGDNLSYLDRNPDSDGNKYVSSLEAYQNAKEKIISFKPMKQNGFQPREPQISNEELAKNTYMLEHKVEN